MNFFVEIRTVDAVTYYENSECDGSQSDVVANQICSISLLSLRNAPYNLKFGDLVVVKIKA